MRHALTVPAGLALLASVACGCPEPGRPNVVLVVVDTLRADAVGEPGSALARLAEQALVFRRATAQSDWTLPSIASLITSRYPWEHGEGTQRKGADEAPPTLAEIAARHGYRTAAFAELDVPFLRRGFEVFETPVGGIDDRIAHPERNGAALTFGAAVDWLRSARREPFLLLLHTYEAHDYFIAKPYQRDVAARAHPAYRAGSSSGASGRRAPMRVIGWWTRCSRQGPTTSRSSGACTTAPWRPWIARSDASTWRSASSGSATGRCSS